MLSQLGEVFWKKLFEKILSMERDISKKKQFQKVSDDKEKSKQQKIEKKTNRFDEIFKDRKVANNLFKTQKGTRKKAETVSDAETEIQPGSIISPPTKKHNSLLYIKSDFKVEVEAKLQIPPNKLATKTTNVYSKKATRTTPHRQGTNANQTETNMTLLTEDELALTHHKSSVSKGKIRTSFFAQDSNRLASPTKKSKPNNVFTFE
jgi:hypothetical protein